MNPEIKQGQDNNITDTAQPFDPNNQNRIAELNKKFEGEKIARFINLDTDSEGIQGLSVRNFNNPNQPLILNKSFFEAQGLAEGTYAQNGPNIIWIKGDSVRYMMDTNDGAVTKKIHETGLKKIEGVTVPSLGNPDLYFTGANDSTFISIQEKFDNYK